MAATGNGLFGYFGGGYTSSNVSSVDRVDYSNDTPAASPKGPLSLARRTLGATGNQSFGYFAGGYGSAYHTTIDRVDYSNDTPTAVARGPLSLGRFALTGATGNQSFGYFAGGGTSPIVTTIDRIDYSNDGVTAVEKGPLTTGAWYIFATGNDSSGYFGGGENPSVSPIDFSTVQRVDYSNDTATASPKGPLSVARGRGAATGNSSFGYFGGGKEPGPISTIDRVDYSNDTTTASPKGPLSAVNKELTASSSRANAMPLKGPGILEAPVSFGAFIGTQPTRN